MAPTLLLNKLGLEILTDSGWHTFTGLAVQGTKHTVTVQLAKSTIILTPDHAVFLDNLEKVPAEKLVPGQLVRTLSGLQKVISVTENCLERVFDLVNVGEDKRFYANDILCSNCEFLIYSETLISAIHLLEMTGKDPIEKQGQIRWYAKPKRGHMYVIALDPSLGTGGDNAAIQVMELPSCIQVAEWQNNKTQIRGQIAVVRDICSYLYEHTNTENDIYYSIENNSIGEAALIAISEMGEENIKGTFLTESFKLGQGRRRKGFTTTNKSKLAACAKFKNMVEYKKMTIFSSNLISELKQFIASGGSYAAKLGEKDDLVMSMLLAIRMIQSLQHYDVDLDNRLKDELDQMIVPMPFIMMSQ